ncbi:MAG: hypothetical protein V4708_02410 [Bacteroidota bacterium]
MDIEVTVDLTKLKRVHWKIQWVWSRADDNNEDVNNWKQIVDIPINQDEQRRFLKRLREILTPHDRKGLPKPFDNELLEQQVQDVIFIYNVVNEVPVIEFKDRPTFRDEAQKVIELLKQIPLTKQDSVLGISVKTLTSSDNFELPPALQSNKLYQDLCKVIVNHLKDHSTNLKLRGDLQLSKEPLKPDYLEGVLRITTNTPSDTTPYLRLAVITKILLNYLRSQPQFPPSKKANSRFSVTQGKFIMYYLDLFELFDMEMKQPETNMYDYEKFRKNLSNAIDQLNAPKYSYLNNFAMS